MGITLEDTVFYSLILANCEPNQKTNREYEACSEKFKSVRLHYKRLHTISYSQQISHFSKLTNVRLFIMHFVHLNQIEVRFAMNFNLCGSTCLEVRIQHA